MPRRPRNEDTPQEKATLEIPHDPINERVIISSAMHDPQSRRVLMKKLRKADLFQEPLCASVWRTFIDLDRKGLEYSHEAMVQLSGSELKLVDLKNIAKVKAAGVNLTHHLETLVFDSMRLGAVNGPINDLLHSLNDPTTPHQKLQAQARAVGSAFKAGGTNDYIETTTTVIREQMAAMAARQKIAVHPYGIEDLDKYEESHELAGEYRIVPGVAPGQITTVTGVSGGGKSTLVARIILGLARQRRRVTVGAWEMQSGPTLELLATMALGYSRTDVLTGKLTEDQRTQLLSTMEKIGEYVTFVKAPFANKRKRPPVHDILDVIHGMILDTRADVFVADLWRRAFRTMDPDEEEAALAHQQQIAQETGCHCILVQQQRLKDIEKRDDKRPTREGIKGTSAWVDVSDTILGVNLPHQWKDLDENTVEILILKQRWGKWPQLISLDWSGDRGRLSNGRTLPIHAAQAAADTSKGFL